MQVVRPDTCASCRPLVDMPVDGRKVSCLLHLYQYDAIWLRPIRISAACVSGRVPPSLVPQPGIHLSLACLFRTIHVSYAHGKERLSQGRVSVGFSRRQFTRQTARVSG